MTVLITGTSRGIGAAMQGVYAARGDGVIGTSRGAGAAWSLDVTDAASHQALAAKLAGQPIDLLVCNAGVYFDRGEALADGFSPAKWTDTFAANVMGVFLTVQTLLPNIKAGAPGKIAIVSSQMGSSTRANGSSYIYRASKAAVTNLGRNLATDLKADGIAVGIYHPGWVQTDMGGAEADIDEATSAAGLVARFDALGLETTGCFEMWNGEAMPF